MSTKLYSPLVIGPRQSPLLGGPEKGRAKVACTRPADPLCARPATGQVFGRRRGKWRRLSSGAVSHAFGSANNGI